MSETLTSPVITGFSAGRHDDEFRMLSDDDLLASAAQIEEMGRRVDALRVGVAGELAIAHGRAWVQSRYRLAADAAPHPSCCVA